MTLDTFLHLVDRVGAPMAILAALVYLIAQLIRGPGMRVAELLGGTLAEVLKTTLGQIAAMPGHISLEHTTTRATVEREGASVRETVQREHAATREHVTTVVGALRDRVSGAENEIVGAVNATGQHQAIRVSQLPSAPASTSAPRPPAATLPSAEAPA